MYQPDPNDAQETLTPPLGAPKHINLLWIEELSFEVVADDSESEYIDTDD